MFLSEFFRLLKIFSVIARYNLFELADHFNVPRGLRLLKWCVFWRGRKYKHEAIGIRLRLAFEELGPVWIKFGQMLSTRRDLFPAEIADQLALLQDNVAPFDGKIARQQIEKALDGSIEQWFDDFDETPLASASIAQVHCATIKSTQENVVLKIIRPAIMSQIQADIRLMYRVAAWVPILMPDGQRLHATEVVHEYEKTLLDELDLRKEASNTLRLRNNFLNSELLYVPNVYEQFTRQNLMVSERIYGVPIADLDTLREKGTNFKLLAERGVQTFFTQVFRDSFFHADMHPGNIFVNVSNPDDPQYIGIDCGIVGILTENDKRYLAENFLAFFNRDYNRIAHLYVSSGWVPEDTSIPEFEQAIRLVCEPVFAKPLSEISFGHLLVNLFQTARRFNMEVQPQLVLLEKTLLYIEGLGRQLYPQLDLWTTAKPFLEQWMEEQLGLKAMIRNVKQRLPYWSERLPELPDLLFETLAQHKKLQKRLKQQAEQQDKKQSKRLKSLFLFLIGCTFVISSCQLLTQGMIKSATYFIIIGIGIWIISWTRVK